MIEVYPFSIDEGNIKVLVTHGLDEVATDESIAYGDMILHLCEDG